VKKITCNDTLVAHVNGASVTPELARVITKKQGGHHLTLRVSANRAVLAYLPTELYLMPALFNAKTKQAVEAYENEVLQKLFARATTLVAKTLKPEHLKSEWDKQLREHERQEFIGMQDSINDNFELGDLYTKRDSLTKQLAEVELAINQQEAARGLLPVLPSIKKTQITQQQVEEYRRAIAEFMLSIAGRKKRDQDAFTWVWDNLDKYAAYTGATISLQLFDYQFYLSYANYCLFVTNNYDNFFGAKIKKIKQFLKFAEGKGYQVNQGYKDKKFKILDEVKEVVYLDDDELDLIWRYKQVMPKRAKVIDLLLFQSLTGLRISDAKKEHTIAVEKKEQFVKGICQKNKGTFLIPLSLDSRIEELLTAHNYDMNLLSDAVYNRQIKMVVAEVYAHFKLPDESITYYRYKLGKPIKFVEPKSHLISSHSMRRGFCTRHLNSGHFNETDVLRMLGSKDMDELQRYIKVEAGALHRKAAESRKARLASEASV
jgi:integrase